MLEKAEDSNRVVEVNGEKLQFNQYKNQISSWLDIKCDYDVVECDKLPKIELRKRNTLYFSIRKDNDHLFFRLNIATCKEIKANVNLSKAKWKNEFTGIPFNSANIKLNKAWFIEKMKDELSGLPPVSGKLSPLMKN